MSLRALAPKKGCGLLKPVREVDHGICVAWERLATWGAQEADQASGRRAEVGVGCDRRLFR